MKKKVICLGLLLLLASALCAANIEDLISMAKDKSSVYQSYEISYRNSLINKEQKDLNGVIVKVDGGYKMEDAKKQVVSPSSVTITVPDLYEDINLTARADLSQINLVNKQPFTLSPSLAIGKDFNIRNFKDTRTDIEDEKTDLQIEISYKTNVCNFENAFINSLINILQTEDKYNDSKTSYDRMLKAYENDILLGRITEGSLMDMEQTMRLNSTKVSLDAMENNLNRAKKDFVQQYGIDYQEVTEVRDADLTFVPSEGGNNTVYIAYLNLQSAQQSLDAQKGFEDKLSVSASGTTSIPFNTDKKDISVAVSASVKYKTDTWEVGTTVSETFSKEKTKIPTVTVSGSWSNTTTKSKSEKLTLQMAENNVLEKETAFSNALYNYETSVQNLETEIENYNLDGAQLKIQKDYHKAVYDYEVKLLDLGLSTQQNLDDARTNFEKDLHQEIIWKLQGLVLENKIKTLEL